MTPSVTVLGPQRQPTLGRVLRTLGVDGPIAAVTAGWQEREGDDGELMALLDGRGRNLRLHARWSAALHDDSDYAAAEREHQVVLDEMQQLYRLRLDHAVRTAYELWQRVDQRPRTIDAALADALDVIRMIDATHVIRVRERWAAFDAAWRPRERRAVAGHVDEITHLLEESSCLVVAGGHVGELLRVLDLFDVGAHLPAQVVAWSAGAMALTSRVVLFHDRVAHGPAQAEVLDAGLAVLRDVVLLPHARRRLRTDDPRRMSVLARRFAPAACVVLDDGMALDLGTDSALPAGARVVTDEGRIVERGAA
ncbi:MAG TPA: hypothetical protein VFJ98_00590 [Mycobacteriales bacterium]|nr:hypothetical protein [Mycobacteriales bacterium]